MICDMNDPKKSDPNKFLRGPIVFRTELSENQKLDLMFIPDYYQCSEIRVLVNEELGKMGKI